MTTRRGPFPRGSGNPARRRPLPTRDPRRRYTSQWHRTPLLGGDHVEASGPELREFVDQVPALPNGTDGRGACRRRRPDRGARLIRGPGSRGRVRAGDGRPFGFRDDRRPGRPVRHRAPGCPKVANPAGTRRPSQGVYFPVASGISPWGWDPLRKPLPVYRIARRSRREAPPDPRVDRRRSR